jgi:purine catabolism regulator
MLTIQQLIEFDHFRLDLAAGARGRQRRITWAHASELRDPSSSLEGGELVMTTSAGLPRTAAEQVAYLERLAARDPAGLLVSTAAGEPSRLTRSLLRRADELGLPILTAVDTPFSALSQAIASGSRELLYERLSTTVRIYGTLGELARTGPDIAQVFDRVSEITGYELSAVTPYGVPLFRQLPPPRVTIPVEHLLAVFERREAEAPLRLELTEDGERHEVSLVPIVARGRPLGVLAGIAGRGSSGNEVMLRHAATVVSLLAADVLQERERRRRVGGEQLTRALAAAEGGAPVRMRDLYSEPTGDWLCYAAIALSPDEAGWADVHHHLRERGILHVMIARAERGRIVAQLRSPDVTDLAETLVEHLPGSVIGLSSVVDPDTDVRRVRREARWALQRALADERRLLAYDHISTPDWLALDHSGLEIMVERILGPLLAHDEETGSELIKTLTVLLEEDRSWKAAATRLYVHRQTLIQRGKRIEQLTGRRLSSTADVTDLWLALRARQVLLRSDAAAAEAAGAPQEAPPLEPLTPPA